MKWRSLGLALALVAAGASNALAQRGDRGDRGGPTSGPQAPGPAVGGRGGAGPERSGPPAGRAVQGQRPGRPEGRVSGRREGGPQIRSSTPRRERIDRGVRRSERVERGQRRARQGAEQRSNRGERRQQRQLDRAEQRSRQQRNRADRRDRLRENRRARDERTPGERRDVDRRPFAPQSGDRTAGDRQGERRAPRLTDEQRQRIRDRLRAERAAFRHHTNVNVRIRPGRKALRSWAYYAVPAFLVELVPWFADYRLAWVEDDYVIVDPGSYEIVAYVEGGTGRIVTERATTYASPGREACASVNLTAEQRQLIRTTISDGPRVELADAEVGIDLPDRVELRTFPGDVRKDVRRIDACRYVLLSDNRIAIIAPRTREVVLIID